MSACAAVLETYELLEYIISQLPARHIFSIKRVAKSWEALIKGSKRIQEARRLMPIDHLQFNIPGYDPLLGASIPLYSRASRVETNPNMAFDHSDSLLNTARNKNKRIRCFLVDDASMGRLADKDTLNDFVTNPPCRVISMKLLCANGFYSHDTACTLYVASGAKIHHLLELSAALVRQTKLVFGQTKVVDVEAYIAVETHGG